MHHFHGAFTMTQVDVDVDVVQVNGHRLLGMNHIEVVTILKDLPVNVRMVCARRPGDTAPYRLIDTSQDRAAFAARVGGAWKVYMVHFQFSDLTVNRADQRGCLVYDYMYNIVVSTPCVMCYLLDF
jgi:hypothetical protein